MSEFISEELFDHFRNSNWPEQFSAMAQAARTEGVDVDQLSSFTAYETGLIIAPSEDKKILTDMGIVEDCLFHRNPITPGMIKDGFFGDPNEYIPRFSEFGKQVIMACEKLFTAQEHADASVDAQSELERIITEAELTLSGQ